MDRVKGEPSPEIAEALNAHDSHGAYAATVRISARKGTGLNEVLAAVERVLVDSMVPITLNLPHQRGDLISLVHEYGVVDQEQHSETGVTIQAHVPPRLFNRLAEANQET
jgi:GTP-binding protein HflX